MEVLQRTANRGSISTGGYEIGNSVKLETGNNEWLYRASPTAGDRRTFTFSFWIKRSTIGNPTASGAMYVAGQGQHGRMYFTNDYFGFRFDDGHDTRDITTLHRDTSAWLHVVVAVDTNQSSSSNRVKIYFNGVQTTTIDHDDGSYPDIQDQASGWFTTNYLTVGTAPFGGSYNSGDGDYDMSGYLAEFCAVDGQQLAPTDFGEFDSDSGIWKPIDVSGINFGSQGYYLDFADASDLGDDESGNGNDFTENNLAAADQATDTPTNNFATLNPLQATSYYTLKEGGTVLEPSQNGWGTGVSSIGVTSGKWYFEQRSTATDRTTIYGVVNESDVLDLQGDKHVGDGVYSVGFYGNSAQVFSNGSVIATYNTFNQNQLVACALDLDNGKVYFAIQNTWQNSADPANGTGGISLPTGGSDTYFFGVNGYFSDNDVKTNHGGYTIQTPDSAASDANGYGTFEYAPPSGYYALCTKNLAEYG